MAAARKAEAPRKEMPVIPASGDALVDASGRQVQLTNLHKTFFPQAGHTKGDLLRYYASVAPWLLPHLKDRAMVMRRYPNGAEGKSFFMKNAPSPRPPWIEICTIAHDDEKVIPFPMIQDLASLLWVINLGCIDLNPWYARCDDVDKPDFLHFDLDPVPGSSYETMVEAALVVRDALVSLKMPTYVKTTGSRGLHVYVPIERGPSQRDVWTFAKTFAIELAARHRKLLTVEYRVASRPEGHILVDYNQNAWGQTLASIYSVRPRPLATVSTPVTWEELEGGARLEDFRLENVPERVGKVGDLWAPVVSPKGRYPLAAFFQT